MFAQTVRRSQMPCHRLLGDISDFLRANGKRGTMKNTWVKNAGLVNAGSNFTGVEKAGPPSTEREMDKYKCIMYR